MIAILQVMPYHFYNKKPFIKIQFKTRHQSIKYSRNIYNTNQLLQFFNRFKGSTVFNLIILEQSNIPFVSDSYEYIKLRLL